MRKGNVVYLAAPLLSAYKRHDYWAYRAIVQGLFNDLLPQRLLYPQGPGWVEFTLQQQGVAADMVHGRWCMWSPTSRAVPAAYFRGC